VRWYLVSVLVWYGIRIEFLIDVRSGLVTTLFVERVQKFAGATVRVSSSHPLVKGGDQMTRYIVFVAAIVESSLLVPACVRSSMGTTGEAGHSADQPCTPPLVCLPTKMCGTAPSPLANGHAGSPGPDRAVNPLASRRCRSRGYGLRGASHDRCSRGHNGCE
jgi:hypothetical protein